MAEPKKKDSKKIADVARPGKTAPSGNSKSVIVSNRPIMKDPMVVVEEATEADEKVTAKPSESVIAPLSDSSEDKIKSIKPDDDSPEPKLKKEDDKKTIAVLANEAAVKKEESDEPEEAEAGGPKLEEQEPSESDEPAVPEPAESANETEPDKATEHTAADDSKSEISTNEADTSKTVTEVDAEELAEKEKHDIAIQKLIDSKQYNLPINSVEKRRSKRVVIFGVLLSILLIAAWVDIALDANIIELNGINPVTHFFSN
jgi:type IV secretory pathway VirB10-like protein